LAQDEPITAVVAEMPSCVLRVS
jgi:hypothetical protein